MYVIEYGPTFNRGDRPELGRVAVHDSRSKAYALPEPERGAIESAKHNRFIPVLNQGNVGACTCFAGLGALGSGEFYNDTLMAAMAKANYKFNDGSGIALYKEVTKIDDIPGTYPPNDTGSNGNAVGKLFKSLGLISGWKHALSLDAALLELGKRPVITGVNWYGGFDQVDAKGFSNISGRVEGGHEFVVDEINVMEEWVGCTNSWSERYGQKGRFKMTFKTWERLLKERGDVTSFVPLTEPAPDPKPPVPPTPKPVDTADQALLNGIRNWVKAKGYTV